MVQRCEIDIHGTKLWYNKRYLYHRTDGPAVVCADGTQMWYLNGKLHRTDDPAVVYADGRQYWYLNDELHRTDGPAVVCADGTQMWWMNDKQYFDNKSFQKAAKLTDEEMSFMIIKYGDVK